MTIDNPKYLRLLDYLKKLNKVAIAFSGGVDSTFLLAAAKNALGEGVVGITIDSPALPRYELEEAVTLAKNIGAKHVIIKSGVIDEKVKFNPENRCYHCKKIEFGSVKEEALKLGIKYILDGSNSDDLKDYRPGMKATTELQVLSPLLELGITKSEIREFSKALNLSTWDKPAYACLFSRIPYGQEIKLEDLKKVENSEKYLIDKGFRTVRVRCHGDIARIEVPINDRIKLLEEPLSSEISNTLKSFGFKYITIDMLGYRMGSFNETIKAAKN
jgi:pyridinium-3,5-biscarboxylic acid mononucleotide sulfurtransferase